MGLKRIAMVDLPSGGDYEHADVHLPSGRVYLANTALDQIEVLDGQGASHLGSIAGCAGGSGLLAVGDAVVAAARGSGELHSVALDGEPDVVLVDSRRACAYVCVGEPPTLHVVDLADRAMRKAISTGAGAKTAALAAERHLLYVFLPKAGQAWVYAL